jgi:hypothetical protein
MYAHLGFTGPLWVTETGCPSRPSLGLRALIDGGAVAVFVSFRDNHEFGRDSPFGSEGVLRWPRLRPKPAYTAVQKLARVRR